MFSTYQIKDVVFENPSPFLERGKKFERDNSSKISNSLDSFLSPTGSVDAALMMAEWFPEEKFDVFISHSRADKDFALELSGWLGDRFGLTAFVDSCVWKHAGKLQKDMDIMWCYQEKTNTYSYESRNITTTHVHMMLASALTKMMDRCESVFFLNTQNSIRSVSPETMITGGDEVTRSPWLFHEVAMLKLLRRRKKEEHREMVTHFAEGVQKRASTSVPDFKYPADLEGISTLDSEVLNAWLGEWKPYRERGISKHDTHPLDLLYGLRSPEPENSDLG